mmetsp:Transcript_19613/g.47909  ORF Transcript_19613/g.47909 Transcript_19613/m.47909 type:complete len:97 (+) Transcript_19613:1162-1452(+)
MDSMMVPYGVRRHHFTSRSLLALLNNAPPPPPPPHPRIPIHSLPPGTTPVTPPSPLPPNPLLTPFLPPKARKFGEREGDSAAFADARSDSSAGAAC